MRLSVILLPALAALVAGTCVSEFDCDPKNGGTLHKRVAEPQGGPPGGRFGPKFPKGQFPGGFDGPNNRGPGPNRGFPRPPFPRTITSSSSVASSTATSSISSSSSTTSSSIATYTGVIKVVAAVGGASLGYLANDPNYWTPLLTSDITQAFTLKFQGSYGVTTFTQRAFSAGPSTTFNGGDPFLGLVVGRDSTSSDLASGSFNYLYIDPTTATLPGSTPQSVPNYFATTSGLNKQAESNVWNINLNTGSVAAQWINTDGSSPNTQLFVQSNHVYAGGDTSAFNSRFPAPVTNAVFLWIPMA